MTRYVAFATKGLEDVAAAELGDTVADGLDWLRPATKHVVLETTGTPETDADVLRRLTTVDDVCVVGAESAEVSTADDLRTLLTGIAPAVDAIRPLRAFDATFSVTITAARTSIGTSRDLATLVADTLADSFGWQLRETSRAPVDVRVFVDGAAAVVGVRLFERPLSERDYRTVHRAGALRPTVAAAMVRLARPHGPAHDVWDPFCGSGTILAEAHRAGHRVHGSDVDPDAVVVTKANLAAAASVAPDVQVADAASPTTWYRHNTVDTVVANLPWGKQISLTGAASMYAQVGVGVAQLAARGGRACLLTTEPDRVAAAIRRAAPDLLVTRRRLGLLGQTPTLLTVGRS